MNLDPHQTAAVLSPAPRILLRAGAGSGKTRVLVSRVVRLLRSGAHPAEILCLTFTRVAAGEMRDRILAELPDWRGMSKLRVTTFHAWAARLLREYHDVVGYSRDFTIRDDQDRTDLIKFVGAELALKWKSAARLWEEDVVRSRYRELMREAQAMGYDDLEHELGRLLAHPDVADQLRRRWLHVLVDEMQDTSGDQQAILDALAPVNLFVVGDHAQSVYGFRGASPAGFTDLGGREGWAVLELPINYRSVPEIVESANTIAEDMTPPGLQMIAARPSESEWAASVEIGALLEDMEPVYRQNPADDLAVLAPTWAILRELSGHLTSAGIPWRLARPLADVWESEEMRWLIQCLRAALNPDDHLSLHSALSAFTPRIGIGDWSRVRAASLTDGSPILSCLRERMPAGCSWLVEAMATADHMEIAWALADELDRLHLTTKAAYMRDVVIEAIETYQHDATAETPEGERLALLDYYATRHLDADAAEADEKESAVTLSTIHGAKGLEWPCVWILAWNEGAADSFGRAIRWMGRDREEQLRLRYVAVTRARDRLRFVVHPVVEPKS